MLESVTDTQIKTQQILTSDGAVSRFEPLSDLFDKSVGQMSCFLVRGHDSPFLWSDDHDRSSDGSARQTHVPHSSAKSRCNL